MLENYLFPFSIQNSLNRAGPGCSKLTMSLVNISLKFQTLISNLCQYFLLKKCEKLLQCKSFSHFLTKSMSVFGYKVIKHLTSWPLNGLVKLTMLWTTGPRGVLFPILPFQNWRRQIRMRKSSIKLDVTLRKRYIRAKLNPGVCKPLCLEDEIRY